MKTHLHNNMKKFFVLGMLVIMVMTCPQHTYAQNNVGINNTTPDPSEVLSIKSGSGLNQGITIPFVDLATAVFPSVSSPTGPVNSLLVHNTNAAYGQGTGIYQNIGTQLAPIWIKFITRNDGWYLYGNRITSAGTPATYGTSKIPSGHWLGTTNATDLTFGTDSIEWMRLTSTGSLGIGTHSPVFGKVTIVGNTSAALTLQEYNGTSNTSNDLVFRRSTGAFNVNTAVPQGTTLGQINFQGYTGATNGYVTGARIRSGADSTVSTTAMPGNLTFWTTPLNSTTLVERMRIRNDGRTSIGISTPDPTDLFTVNAQTSALPFAINGYTNQDGSAVYGNTSTGTTNFSSVQGEYGGSGNGSGVSGSYYGTGTSNTRSGVFGTVTGPATSSGGAGVYGYNAIGSGIQRMGVLGTYNGGAFGIGVYGIGFGGGIIAGNNDVAVVGWRANNANYSGYFNGNHVIANGTKSASVGTSQGNQLLYATELPEVWFEDVGGGQLINGVVHIKLDALFLETIFVDETHPMRIFLQEEGESNGLIVIKDPDNKGFTVKEKNGGTSNITFSYRIMAKRLHFQDHRFGCDPVWGSGDTRKYNQYATPPPVDYEQNIKFQEQQKRDWKPTPMPEGFIYELEKQLPQKSSLKNPKSKKGFKFKKQR